MFGQYLCLYMGLYWSDNFRLVQSLKWCEFFYSVNQFYSLSQITWLGLIFHKYLRILNKLLCFCNFSTGTRLRNTHAHHKPVLWAFAMPFCMECFYPQIGIIILVEIYHHILLLRTSSWTWGIYPGVDFKNTICKPRGLNGLRLKFWLKLWKNQL